MREKKNLYQIPGDMQGESGKSKDKEERKKRTEADKKGGMGAETVRRKPCRG